MVERVTYATTCRDCSRGAYLGAYLGSRLARQREPLELVTQQPDSLRDPFLRGPELVSDLRRRVFAPVARSWDRTVEVVHATTTGENAVRRNGSLRMDTSRWADAERWIERNGWHDEALVGIWHTHPDLTGKDASEPSDTDLRMFLAARDLTHKTRGAAYSVGLILTLRRVGGYLPEHSWLNPDVHAFVSRRSRAGTPVTERANVEGWR